jgi:hypothetical protein
MVTLCLFNGYFIKLQGGKVLPRIPAGGFHSEEEIARLPGARRIDAEGVVPGPSASSLRVLSQHDPAEPVPHPDSVNSNTSVQLRDI